MRRSPVLSLALTLAMGLWLAGCGGETGPAGGTDTAAPLDTATVWTPDSAAADGSAPPVTSDTEIVDHGFGDPCETGDDCYSGVCVEHMGSTVCTKGCDEDCPAGWACEQVSGASNEPIFVCVSTFEHLCRPCMTSADCASETSEAACVDYDGEGAFCGASCDVDSDCPEGFACQQGTSIRGGSSSQCVDIDGICECSDIATALGLATRCAVSSGVWSCEGVRTCTAEGLTECDAPTPVEESCNGVDDDCDGELDEVDCDDDNPCTADTCEGADGCQNTAVAGVPCDDEDPATSDDLCTEDGSCTGTAIGCPSDDCIQTATPNGTDCDITYKPLSAFCDDGDPGTKDDICDGAGTCKGTPYSCEPSQCEATATPDGVGCTVEHWASGTACDDDDPGTKDDLCDGAGLCAGTAYSCEPTQCQATSEPNGVGCVSSPKAAGIACDDGLLTTRFDACDGMGGCAGEPYSCTPGSCAVSSATNGTDCTETPAAMGTPCDDGEMTTKDDTCDGQGVCVGAAYTCTPGLCELFSTPNGSGCDLLYTFAGAACDDGDLSTLGDACDGQGGCAGTPYTCTPGLCDVSSTPNGFDCDFEHMPAGTACDDDAIDTKNDQCDGLGACVGTAYTCEPTQCEVTSVINGIGCDVTFMPAGTTCDDGDLTTKDDQCDGDGGCTGTTFVCESTQCVTSTPNGAGCDVVYPGAENSCDDGDPTTKADHCDGQGGCAGSPYGCAPSQCEATSTPDGTGCVPTYKDAGASCDDANVGTKLDQCDGQGTCMGTPYTCEPTQCEDTSTPDGVGCVPVYSPAGANCDDQQTNTKNDQCDGQGGCTGSAYSCEPTQCEDTSTPDGVGCVPVYSPAGANCNDQQTNTKNDQCDGQGGCTGSAYSCEPTQCESTSTPDGVGCIPQPKEEGTACNDLNVATVHDVCDGQGGCQGIPPTCGDGETEGLEACDDSNTETEPCTYGQQSCTVCNSGCELVDGAVTGYCGDLDIQSAYGEVCDDGNTNDGDSCSSDCTSTPDSCPTPTNWTEVWSHALTSTPSGAIVQNGAWHGQGVESAGGRSCWMQNSDWNILWIPHPAHSESRYAVQIDSFRPNNGQHISGYFAANTEKTGYNGTVNTIGMSTVKENLNLNLDVHPSSDSGVSLSGQATRGVWNTWRVEIDKDAGRAAFFQNGTFLECREISAAAAAGSKIKVGSNGIAYQTEADACWSNLIVEVPQ